MTDTLTLESPPPAAAPAQPLTLAQAVTQVANAKSIELRQRPLNADELAGIAGAFSTKGKRLLLASCPTGCHWRKAAWNGLQPNPFKFQMSAAFFLPDGPRDFLTFLSDNVKLPAAADRDAGALQRLGVW